jgi:large subunit ribosomal protein L22
MATTEIETREVRAQAKWVRVSARKARVVTEHIRGRSVPEARTVLAFTSRAAAREIEKVLRSAVANAEANHGLIGDDLVVTAAYVDEGPTLKRWRPRARGRAARIHKRTCHITVRLAEPANGARPTRAAVVPAAAEAGPQAGATDKPKRRLRRGAAPEAAEPTTQATAEEAAPDETSTETTAEAPQAAEKPKRTRRKKTEE